MPSAASPRQKTFLLAEPEQRVLHAIAARLPARVMPDHLTALGVVAALGIAASYVLSGDEPLWLIAATVLLAVHWLGDSLDGTLARVRKIERPTYGYYLDHLVDGLATAAIGIGLGLSPHMLLATGLVIVVAYLLLSINTYLETSAFGVFSLGYGRIGPTEARIGLAALNVAMLAGLALETTVLGIGVTVLDLAGLVIAAVMIGALLVRASQNLRKLAEREPSAAKAAKRPISRPGTSLGS
jgi:archaetidylinositol phosphate synthase